MSDGWRMARRRLHGYPFGPLRVSTCVIRGLVASRIAFVAFFVALLLTGLFAAVEAIGLGETPSILDFALDFVETLILVAAIFASVLILPRLRALESETTRLRKDVGAVAAAGAEWRARMRGTLASLSESIEAQFAAWELTSAERDVAGLILKGMSLKDIAVARSMSEATIRQQAQSVYRKAGLSGRAELSAYFLEDLFDVREAAMAGADGTPPGATRQ
jgi:DNA-binding CsgD family transcriptional regulator